MDKMITIKRLERLSELISRYADEYRKGPSARQDAWADEYDTYREEQPLAWEAYCRKHGYSPTHDSMDSRA